MIVEVDIGLGAAIATRLRHLGLKVTVLRDGTDAAARILEEAPDLVVLDFAVPGRNGLEIAETISASAKSDCEMILYTGSDCEQITRRAAMSGIRILRKEPGSLLELQREISQRLARSDMETSDAAAASQDGTGPVDEKNVTCRFESRRNHNAIKNSSPHACDQRSTVGS